MMGKAINENLLLTSSMYIKQKEYWVDKLSGAASGTRLLFIQQTSDVLPGADGTQNLVSTVGIDFDEYSSDWLLKVSKGSEISLYIILLTALKCLIYHYTGNNHISVISPLYKPNITEDTLNDYVYVYDNVSGDSTFKELILRLRESVLDAYRNQDFPFEKILTFLSGTNRDDDGANRSVVECCLGEIHQPGDMDELEDRVVFSFNMENQRVRGTIHYNPRIYPDTYVKKLPGHLINILQHASGNIDCKVSGIPILSAQEKEQLLEDFNNTHMDYPGDSLVHRLFEEQAARTPDDVAVTGPTTRIVPEGSGGMEFTQLTYRQLNARANRLASVLREKDIKPGAIVAIMVRRSIEMVVGVMGVLKAGGAYMPIDPDCPPDRIKYMLADSGAAFLVTTSRLSREPGIEPEIVCLDSLPDIPGSQPGASVPMSASGLCYVIYTSGTTGKPKGVMIEHRSMVNRLYWIKDTFRLTHDDVVLQKTNFTFDVSACEMFRWILPGAQLCILPEDTETDSELICQLVQRYKITVIEFVPSMLKMFLEYVETENALHQLQSLRWVFTGAETITPRLVEAFERVVARHCDAKLINVYGPTEATVDVTYYDCSQPLRARTVPIGKPNANTRVFILDKHHRLLPIGVPGELIISGASLGRGYLNRPELTAEKFLQISIHQRKFPVYKTGDLARWLPDGNIEFLGRIDQQVKIRGFRIEPGEIEAQLLNHPDIKNAVVIDRESKNGDKHLIAYAVCREHNSHPDASAALMDYLGQHLPDYMIPSYIVPVDYIPLTPNGKIDRKLLPEPQFITDENYVAPRGRIEAKLVEIWSQILGIPKEKIGIHSNFFHLGGHSLKATILLAKIHKEMNARFPLVEVFSNPTVKQLAAFIKAIGNTEEEKYNPIPPAENKEYYPLSSAQKRFYIVHHLKKDNITYNMPFMELLKGRIHRGQLEDAYKKLIDRHESLRTSFQVVDGEPVQKIHSQVSFAVRYVEGGSLKAGNGWEDDFIKPFDLSRAPLLRVYVITFSETEHLLFMDLHHIIFDGISSDILKRDLDAFMTGKALPPITIHYKDYSQWHNREKQNLEEQETYWLNRFQGQIPVLNLPFDFPRPRVQSFAGRSLEFEIRKEETMAVRSRAEREDTNLNVFLFTLFNILLYKICRQEDIIVGVPMAGRNHPDLEHIIGAFVNSLALRNCPSGEKSLASFLHEVKTGMFEAFENQDYQFEDLISSLSIDTETNRNPLFNVIFTHNYMGGSPIDFSRAILVDGRVIELQIRVSHLDLIFYAFEYDESIKFYILYSTDLFERATIEEMKDCYLHILRQVLSGSDLKLEDISVSGSLLTAQSANLLDDAADYNF